MMFGTHGITNNAKADTVPILTAILGSALDILNTSRRFCNVVP
jgi:hypothetical protein